MADNMYIQDVLKQILDRIDFHKMALNRLEQQKAKIESEIKAALSLLSEDKISAGLDKTLVGTTITGDETPYLMNPKDAIRNVVGELNGIFTLTDIYNKIIEKGIVIHGANAYKRISAALVAMAKSGDYIQKVKYGEYKVK